ncbi:hypothetical protein LJC57_05065 [Parabacteroides sp. OttesenSCG-928-G07]|nr:hypothetical protein [Parabacteroides sp. OttesenSCG-928-G21]MDL2277946.1 hypothetical protein [Parabacteroides sp. OttesenSCG-928-G07]
MAEKYELLEKALESVPDTILIVDDQLKIVKVIPNDESVGITVAAENHRVDAIPDLNYPGNVAEQIIDTIRSCMKGDVAVDYDFPVLMRDGMYVYLKARMTPLDHKFVILYVRNQTDVVERVKGEHHADRHYMLELALKKSKTSAFSFSFDRFNSCDRVNCNRCFQFYGSTNELLNRNMHICRALPFLSHPKDRKDFFFLFNNLKGQKMDEANVSFRLKDDDGEYRHYKVYGKVDGYDENGEADLIIGSIIDVQEHHEYEKLKKKVEENNVADVNTPDL